MKCPYCGVDFHIESYGSIAFPIDNNENDDWGMGFLATICPSCKEISLIYIEGKYQINQMYERIEEPYSNIKILYPLSTRGIKLSKEVPDIYKNDFEEASIVLPLSPKASAALSRRCLQNFLHDHLNIKERTLAKEIRKFIETQSLPSYLLDAVDAIRNIGNFAAHPMKDTNTGEVVNVEPGEAEWLLEVLEMIFDFYFIQPAKLKQRRTELNEKLKAVGKPPLPESV